MLNLPWTEIWSEEELYSLQIRAVDEFLRCRTPQAVEASLELAKVLNAAGLDGDNYPLFLELFRDENPHVTEALIGKEDAFDLFAKVPPNPYIVGFCFDVLYRFVPGRVSDLALEMISGILYRVYHNAHEGHKLSPLTVERLNSLGKFLDKDKDQSHRSNRFILDILGDITELKSINREDPATDAVAAHAVAIRNAFFDRKRRMDSALPPEILKKQNDKWTPVAPRKPRPLNKPAARRRK
jgi:hypothetical protein